VLALPPAMLKLIAPFVPHFSARIWLRGPVLLAGAIVAAAAGSISRSCAHDALNQHTRFDRSHRVLNRASWGCLVALCRCQAFAHAVDLAAMLITSPPSGNTPYSLLSQ
jgi:hypothetical protein